MLSFVVHRGGLQPRQKPLPRLEPGWALVQVHLVGICNTDLEILRGYHNFRGTPGHEFVGEVVDARGRRREADTAHSVGRRVVGEINIACASRGAVPLLPARSSCTLLAPPRARDRGSRRRIR